MFNAFTGIIQGRVQGVGFRYFAKSNANELQITGWVRNLPDGTVEVLAIGTQLLLEQFMQCLEKGPIGSRVERHEFHWFQEKRIFNDFEIKG